MAVIIITADKLNLDYKSLMGKLFIIFVLSVLLISFHKKTFAENLTTGNASAKSEVNIEVNGNGEVSANIKVQANGEKKELNITTPGNYKLEVTSSASESESPKLSFPTISLSPQPISTSSNKITQNKDLSLLERFQSIMNKIISVLSDIVL